MNIGIMRNFKKPSSLTELITVYSKAFNLNIIYIRPRDINIETGKVNGVTLVNGQWINIHTDIPKFIDISPYCFKKENSKVIEYLRKNIILSDNGLNSHNKMKFIDKLYSDDRFKYLVIPTETTNLTEDFMKYLDLHGKLILKPVSGQFGSNIFFVSKDDGEIKLLHGTKEETVTENELRTFFDNEIKNKKYIMQKFIDSRSKQGHPFDCRINMEKNHKGEWVVARMFIRIGIGQKVVSNISQGGAVSGLKSFLKANFTTEQSKNIENDLKKIAKTIPHKVEELRKQTLMTLGIDVGIDKDGSVYLFEVNSAPGTTQLRAQVAELRAQYYSYMKDKIQKEQKEVN